MPWIPGAPKLPKSNDPQKVYNAGRGTNAAMTQGFSGANGPASSADIALYHKRREAKIARGEDPGEFNALQYIGRIVNANGRLLDAAAKKVKAKKDARKNALKRLFGMKTDSAEKSGPQSGADVA